MVNTCEETQKLHRAASQKDILSELSECLRIFFPKSVKVDCANAEDLSPETKAGIEAVLKVYNFGRIDCYLSQFGD